VGTVLEVEHQSSLEGDSVRFIRRARAGAVRAGYGLLATLALLLAAQPLLHSQKAETTAPAKVRVSAADAKPVLDALRPALPHPLNAASDADLPSAWRTWSLNRDDDVRARLERGDEDSIMNLWLFGTSFTRLPPARTGTLAMLKSTHAKAQLLEDRLTELIETAGRSGKDERVAFVRQHFQERGIDPSTPDGHLQMRTTLIRARERSLAEFAETDRRLQAARASRSPSTALAAEATIFRERGLSSDTSILVNFAVERTLAMLKARGTLRAGSVRRVAIVGPGLDFMNKADGHDFYPQQTIQPFALYDSLNRLGLAGADGVRTVTLDISPRVNHHLQMAGARARAGQPYVVHVPLPRKERWTPDLLDFWKHFGDRIGAADTAARPPDPALVDVRAVRIPPALVLTISPARLNIVTERLQVAPSDRFDLVVATNVLVYYDAFEQALAGANIAQMLRPGGVLLSNNDIAPLPPFQPTVGFLTVDYSDRHYDEIFTYLRN
jgi:hypothetical protein